MNLVLTLGLCGFASAFALRVADPLVPTFSGLFGVDLTTAALVATAYALPYSLCQPLLGPISDAIGRVRTIRFCLLILTIGLCIAAVAPSFSVLVGGRALSGLVAGGIIPVAMAMIGDRIGLEQRQIAVSRFIIATISGQMAGAVAGGIIGGTFGWRPVFILSAVLAVASTIVAFLALKPGHRRTPADAAAGRGITGRIVSVFENPRAKWVYLMVAAEGAAMFGIFPYVAAILRSHDGSGAFEAGAVIGAFGVGGIVYALTVQWILPRLGQLPMARLGGIVSGLLLVVLAVPIPWWVTAVPMFVVGYTFYMLHNTLQTQATELAPHARGTAMALFASSFFGGQALGPVLFGALAAVGSFALATVLFAAVLPALGLLAPRLLVR